MTPLTWMWLLSITGALAFFGAGALLHRRRVPTDATLAPELIALEQDRAQLADEVARLSRELGELRRPVRPERDSAVVFDVEALRRRVADADELRQENVELRAEATRARNLAARVTALEGELEAARQSGLAAAARATAGGPRIRLATVPAVSALDGLVADLRATPGVTAAVVSDDLGLLVAGGGELAEALAALGGLLVGVGGHAGELVALGAPVRVVVEDERGTTVSATRLAGAQLVAVTLSPGQASAPRTVAPSQRATMIAPAPPGAHARSR